MKTYTVNGKSAISIDPQLANNVSNQYLADTYLHEIMHAITTDPINDAKLKKILNLETRIEMYLIYLISYFLRNYLAEWICLVFIIVLKTKRVCL